MKQRGAAAGPIGREGVGSLTTLVQKHAAVPQSERVGYFSVQEVCLQEDGRPKVTLVATTPLLQKRATSHPAGTTAIDGGHGFCVHGFPLMIKGELDGRGHCAPTELMLTSTMSLEHVQDAIQRSAVANETVSGRSSRKAFGMTDGEQSFIQSLENTHFSKPLMCFFHVCSLLFCAKLSGPCCGQCPAGLLRAQSFELETRLFFA